MQSAVPETLYPPAAPAQHPPYGLRGALANITCKQRCKRRFTRDRISSLAGGVIKDPEWQAGLLAIRMVWK